MVAGDKTNYLKQGAKNTSLKSWVRRILGVHKDLLCMPDYMVLVKNEVYLCVSIGRVVVQIWRCGSRSVRTVHEMC